MSDNSYPKPECEFGIAIKQDMKHIKNKLDEITQKQDKFEDLLQNGLTTQVANLHDKVGNLEEEKEEKQKREKQHNWQLQKIVITALLTDLGALAVGVAIGFLGF